jgi:PAS domain S-box-containing protein
MTESEIVFKNLAEQSFVGVYISQDGKFQYANPRMAEIFGYGLDDFIGKLGPENVIHPADWPEIKERSKKRLVGEVEKDYYCFRGVKKDHSVIYLEVYGFAIVFKGKRAVTGMVNDISAKMIAEESLQREIKRRNDFITIAAHELRTPLQPVYAYIELMIADPEIYGLNDQGKKTVRQLKWSIDHENAVVNRILELSTLKIEKEKITPLLREVSPKYLVDLVLRSHQMGSDAEIEITIPEDVTITSDVDYLFGILEELCSNAVQYSNPVRKITIGYKEDKDSIGIFVQDNGIGIPPEEMQNIFHPFYLVDAPDLSRKYGRMGLGLTLAKERAELLGGGIEARSELGKGSIFTVKLPKKYQKAGTP